jgi:hypothetical protein
MRFETVALFAQRMASDSRRTRPIHLISQASRRKLILPAHNAKPHTAGAKQGLEWVPQNTGNDYPEATDSLIEFFSFRIRD